MFETIFNYIFFFFYFFFSLLFFSISIFLCFFFLFLFFFLSLDIHESRDRKGRGRSILTPLENLDISRTINEGSSPLSIASNQTGTENVWFPSESHLMEFQWKYNEMTVTCSLEEIKWSCSFRSCSQLHC